MCKKLKRDISTPTFVFRMRNIEIKSGVVILLGQLVANAFGSHQDCNVTGSKLSHVTTVPFLKPLMISHSNARVSDKRMISSNAEYKMKDVIEKDIAIDTCGGMTRTATQECYIPSLFHMPPYRTGRAV
ncbi:hypothetical protein CHS0354_016466 [Potamilus streckersoni]|uniref:Uncharacterized protein n=1 Tax=Potamilus streckersoni TaxID=2493646 RepID=A0AAE0TKD8_9BIVA|nr:hypothetical protein CHS0354_016466 [Potamilus streckersoni]